jgi:hypothetical protein
MELKYQSFTLMLLHRPWTPIVFLDRKVNLLLTALNTNSLQLMPTGAPRLARPPRPEPCLDFGFQYAFIRNNWSKKFGVEYRALPGLNSPWRRWQCR